MTTQLQPQPQKTGLVLPNIVSALQDTLNPTIIFHNRLEGAPRADNFERAQRCEIRDAAFMIGLAYAHGEHLADDAGSLAFAKVNLDTTRIRRYRARGMSGRPFDDTMPLEALVERRLIPMAQGGVDVSLDIRLVMGRQWVKMVSSIGSFEAEFAARFPITVGPSLEDSSPLVGAHAEAWCEAAAVAGRRVDGFKLYEHLRANTQNHAYDGIGALAPHQAAVAALERPFIDWFHRVFAQSESTEQDAWDASRMEYQFSCVAPWAGGDQVLAADEYYHGRLDWYSVDIERQAPNVPDEPRLARESRDITVTTLPAAVSFDGMPNARLWTFEDRRTNFGEVNPATTDLAKLLLVEFALGYSNDWHLIPCSVPHGLARIRGLVATTVFGERFWIAPAGSRDDESWQKWGLYLLDSRGDRQRAPEATLLLLPTPAKVQEGRPREEILIVRDEVLNSVWAIEERIALATGDTKPGLEAARQTLAFHEAALARRLAAMPPPPSPPVVPSTEEQKPKPDMRYQVMNSVAENWIPFIPVHVEGSDTQIKLQRASMLRILENDPDTPAKIRPRTSILRHGLDGEAQCAYFIDEEEAPRNGVRVKMSFQSTRWTDGSVWVWLGMRKQSGRGERSSGLAFDQLSPVPPESNS